MIWRLVFLALSMAASSLFVSAQQTDSAAVVLSAIKSNQLTYHTLNIKTKTSWDDGKSATNFVAGFRGVKDSLLWASFSTAGGIEAARTLLAPDTFLLMSKLTGQLVRKPFSYISEWLYYPFTYQMIEQLVAGTAPVIVYRDWHIEYLNDTCILYLESEKTLQKLWVNTQSYTVYKMLLKDRMLSQQALFTFEGYNEVNGKQFPYKRIIEINRGEMNARLEIQVSRVSVNEPLSMPFEVTERMKE